jgi:hypothetical protein
VIDVSPFNICPVVEADSLPVKMIGIFPGICVWGCPINAGGVSVQCFI